MMRQRPREWQTHLEGRALARAVASRRHLAPMHLDQLFDDGEAETKAAVRAGESLLGLPEPIEYEWQKIRGDADTSVGDGDRRPRSIRAEPHVDATPFGGELTGV